MALAAVQITLGQSLGGGNYNSIVKGAAVPDLATILADITTALGNASGSTDSTDDITVVQTDATALIGSITGDVVLIFDKSVVTSRKALRAALQKALEAVNGGYGGLAE